MLTQKQRDLLDFICKRIERDGVSPSFDEMKDALDLRSKSGIHRLITALEDRGFIRRLPNKARALEILRMPEAAVSTIDRGGVTHRPRDTRLGETRRATSEASAYDVPVMGRIAAGTPIEAISDVTSHVAVPPQMMVPGRDHYALEVKGDSMIEAGINNGDIVIIEEGSAVRSGEIVVALVEGHEATLKRLRTHGDMIALEPANAAYETRVLARDKVTVQGKLVGLLRVY